MHCKCTLAMVFQCPGLCLALSYCFSWGQSFQFFHCLQGLPHVWAVWGSCPGCVLLWGWMRSLVLLLTEQWQQLPWAAGSITLTAWAVSTSSAARPALTQVSKIQKHQAWATERKWGPSSRAAWLCAGVSPGLAAHWTGKTVRHRQAPPTRLHYKQKHPDRNFSQTVQTPAPEEYLRAAPVVGMALDWAVWHKWIANAQNKMPIMVLTLGARLFSPSCAHVSQAAADWGLYTPSLPPNL